MKSLDNFRKVGLLALTLVLMSFTISYGHSQDEFSFKVHNKTESTIKKLLASEDGKTFGYFDIGKGIGPGQKKTLVWDKSTDEEECVQYFKAVFENGEESRTVKFDFCEEDLELVIE
jgi:hypothetical protein